MKRKDTRLLVSRLFYGSCIFCLATLTYLNLSLSLQSDCGNGNEIGIPPEINTATAIKWSSSSSSSPTNQSLVKPVAEQPLEAEAEAATASTAVRKTFHETGSETKPSNEESVKAAPTAHPRDETPQKKEPQEQKRSKRARFWKYDSFGPKIEHARTHLLSSIPPKHRVILSPEERNALSNDPAAGDEEFFDLLRDRYSSRPENLWPNKIHLAEMNPCIARLPERYRNNASWRSLFDGTTGTTSMPQYVSVYRVTHMNNCYDGTTFANFFGGSWDIPLRKINKTDYLGVSLMDADLNVVLDTTVDLRPVAADPSLLLKNRRKKAEPFFFPRYDDFRLFNLGNDAENEQLYLSSTMYISPIELELVSSAHPSSEHHKVPDSFFEIPPAFGEKRDAGDIIHGNHRDGTLALKVWARNYTSCPVGSHDGTVIRGRRVPSIDKNLLYFGADAHRTAKVLMYPRHNPNDVRRVDLDEPCDSRMRPAEIANAADRKKNPGPNQAVPSFRTIEARKYRKIETLFLSDRGSACCVRVKRNLIRETLRPVNDDDNDDLNNHDYDNNDSNSGGDDDQELLVAVVHPKTKFPGKSLPKDVIPNTYLSRFIAFLPEEPYTIVAKTGMFCLGYPERGTDDSHHHDYDYYEGGKNPPSDANPLTFRKMGRLRLAETIHDCPRIHFVMGMTEKVKKDPSEEDSVLISYGVSDCLSRFVEIKKSEIVRMFAGSSA